MYTARFHNFKGDNGVSIALYSPNFWLGEEYKALAPTHDIWYEYQWKKDQKLYTERFNKEVLNKLNPLKVYEDLKDSVLLCYEDGFCHRFLVAKWIEINLGYKVIELK